MENVSLAKGDTLQGIPPEHVNLLVTLTSGVQFMGRNIGGDLCYHNFDDDRFYVCFFNSNGWKFVKSYVVVGNLNEF